MEVESSTGILGPWHLLLQLGETTMAFLVLSTITEIIQTSHCSASDVEYFRCVRERERVQRRRRRREVRRAAGGWLVAEGWERAAAPLPQSPGECARESGGG